MSSRCFRQPSQVTRSLPWLRSFRQRNLGLANTGSIPVRDDLRIGNPLVQSAAAKGLGCGGGGWCDFDFPQTLILIRPPCLLLPQFCPLPLS